MTNSEHVAEQLCRIEEDRKKAVGINAILEINPDALTIAQELDRLPASCGGALHGMTVLLKDNINTGDAMHTSAGTLALADHRAAEDAAIVRRLRKEGAVILGKANMTELASFMSYEMPPGYSARGGLVKNPHNMSQSPSGSSSGSAAAVAAGFCDAAVGTETYGSIISPSQHCGVVGIKPTIGLLSRTGIIPISHTLDTAGPITATVSAAAKLLSVMAGYDQEDEATAAIKDRPVPDYAAALHKDSLRSARIGVGRGIKPSEKYRPHAEKLLRFLNAQGAQLVEIEPIGEYPQILDIMKFEFEAAMDYYLENAGRNALPRSLADIAAYNRAHPDTALRYGQDRLESALLEASGLMNEPVYLNALTMRRTLQKRLNDLFEAQRLDAIVETAGWNSAGPFCGFPAGTVPIGRYDNNIPVGCYLMCRPYEEAKLLALLHGIEQHWP